MKIQDIRATTVTVPLEAPLRHANGCHWGRFVRTIVEVETDNGLIGSRTPMHRFGKPEELVGVAVLLSSDGASFLTGQCIAVDGGYLASGVNS
jgi:NAD(P)-dependent dehydrogenase (short-subunit alcohol dehydrogenase family)